jgi:hypothetical protein
MFVIGLWWRNGRIGNRTEAKAGMCLGELASSVKMGMMGSMVLAMVEASLLCS